MMMREMIQSFTSKSFYNYYAFAFRRLILAKETVVDYM